MKNRIKPIRNENDYEEALLLAEELVIMDPAPNTDEADQLSIIATLIEGYEKSNFPLDIPSAIDAIKFRMDQLDLRPVDLVPYLGSASRVSEILSGKRSLTVDMINALSAGLGIPEKALLKKESKENDVSIHISTPVYKQMLSRGYFGNSDITDRPSLLGEYFSRYTLQPEMLYRRSKFRTSKTADAYSIVAWVNRVIDKAAHINTKKYKPGTIDKTYMQELVKLSRDDENGVQKAINKLRDDGVIVIIEPALTGMKLDGVVIFENKDNPIIGLTLRYNRLDNFWFTLMHELAHIALHSELSNNEEKFIYDDLETRGDELSDIEKEADELAGETLVDSAKWAVSAAKIMPSPLVAQLFADEIGVHVAIVAGKARHESGSWKYLSGFVGKFTVREKFEGVIW